MSDTNTEPEVRLQGDITEVTRVVLLVKNEFVFLKSRAENGTVTTDDLTGLETALTELKGLHPDVADSVDGTDVGTATIGTDPTAGPTASTNEGPTQDNSGPGPEVPTNVGQPAPIATDDDPIDNSNNTVESDEVGDEA